jgi:adenylate cyclase
MSQSRRLAGILAADVVGYSAKIGTDEAGTLARVRALRTDLIEPLATSHGGRLFKTTGDGFLAAFTSSVEALRCAIAIQERLSAQPGGLRLRIGVHQGEVVAEGDDLVGDGVIIAARLEPLAEPGGICISARVREDAAGKIALDVEDIGTPELKNIEQKVHVYRVRRVAAPKAALPLPEKPSLVVLPFQNLSGDPEQEYFADGVVEDITTALSRTGWLFVIARNSAFTFKGRAVDVRQVGRELGVRYVLEGSVRRAGGRVRITCQLIEAATGHHVWADRFDGEHGDIFDLQDRITETVVGAVEPSLERAEITRTSTKPTDSLDAYDLYLMALQQHHLLTQAGNREARRLLRQAIAIDAHFGQAKALAAMSVSTAVDQRWLERDSAEAIEAVALARSALADAPNDPLVLRLAGYTVAFVGYDLERGRVALERALALNPNSAQVLGANGWLRNWLGEFDVARDYFTRAIRLSPLDPELARYQSGLAFALAMGEPADPERAFNLIREALAAQPNSRSTLIVGTQCLVKLGRIDEARQMALQLRAIWPETLSGLRQRVPSRPHVTDASIALLRLAGLPE